MRYIIGLIAALLIFSSTCFAGTDVKTEVEAASKFLAKMPKQEAEHIRFFTTYAMPKEYRTKCVLALSFWIHSLMGTNPNDKLDNVGYFKPLATFVDSEDDGDVFLDKLVEHQKVPGSETLWWIDLRDYNWTAQAWENVAEQDGYFRQPMVGHRAFNYMRLIAGNAVLRADWFIVHTSDPQRQIIAGRKPLYYELLYAKHKKRPTTLEEFKKVWKIFDDSLEFGSVVTKSRAVAQHNRFITGERTLLGYYYQTYDVLTSEGKRDYVENPPINQPEVFDAGESIATNQLHLQVYFLTEGDDRVEFGNPDAVTDTTSWATNKKTVHIARSCVSCHGVGINPVENTLDDSIKAGLQLNFKDYNKYRKIKAQQLQEERFEQKIKDDQELYARAVKNANGLTPERNARIFVEIINWYDRPLTIKQAALECGVTVEEFKKVGIGISGRLHQLVTGIRKLPRVLWESPGKDGVAGHFAQAMILLNGESYKEYEIVEETVEPVYYIVEDTFLYHGKKRLARLRSGEEIDVDFTDPFNNTVWVRVRYNNKSGFVKRKFIQGK